MGEDEEGLRQVVSADIDDLMNFTPPMPLPFMITQAQKQRLREMGYDEER
jgi:hypothetical protein